jgi:hypothetical protein
MREGQRERRKRWWIGFIHEQAETNACLLGKRPAQCKKDGGEHTWESLEQYATPLHLAQCSTVYGLRQSA